MQILSRENGHKIDRIVANNVGETACSEGVTHPELAAVPGPAPKRTRGLNSGLLC